MGEVDQQRSSNVVEFGHAMLYLYPMYDRILMASNLQASTEKNNSGHGFRTFYEHEVYALGPSQIAMHTL
jgi:hypothetical protein